jgi:hypothetical protein
MPSLATILSILGALAGLGVGAWFSDAIRSFFGFKTAQKQSDTSLKLAQVQIDAGKDSEIKREFNRLIQQWQEVVVESKEREAQLLVQKYINEDLQGKVKAKDETIQRLRKRLNEPDDFDDYE